MHKALFSDSAYFTSNHLDWFDRFEFIILLLLIVNKNKNIVNR